MSLINTKHCKEFALGYAAANRPKFKRVGKSFLQRVEARLRNIITEEVQRHPSLGVTLK